MNCTLNTSYFKPKGIAIFQLEEVSLSLDELEAIRLADHDKCYREDASARMKVSRATFGRIFNKARNKVAEAIVDGKALRIETNTDKGGNK